jgi:outer membrane protein TolC
MLFIAAMSTAAHAQSVDSLIRAAYRNNPQLESLGHQADAAEYRASAAGAMPAPSLGIEFSQVPVTSANIVNEAVSDNLSVSQMFMLGGKLSAMSRVERKKGAYLEHTRAEMLVKVRAAVRLNYLQLWRLDRQIEIQRKTIGLLETLAESLTSGIRTNRARSADLLTVQAETASERARLIDLTAKRSAQQNVLLSLTAPAPALRTKVMQMATGRDAQTEDASMSMDGNAMPMPSAVPRFGAGLAIRPDSALRPLPAALSLEELTAMLLDTNPSLQSMEHMREMNDLEIDAAKRELVPDLMLQFMVMRMPNGMVLTGGPRSSEMIRQAVDGMAMKTTEYMYSVTASVTLPFAPWSSERSTAKADEMRSMNLSVDADKRAMQREMLSSLGAAVDTYQAQDSLVHEYSQVILPLIRQAADAQTSAYQSGQASIQAVIDACKMELMKTDDYLMAVMNQHMTFIDIEMMVGVPLQ